MLWKTLPGYFNSGVKDRPRLLNENEISIIISHFKLAPAADRESAELNRSEMIKNIVSELKSIEISPSAIPDLIKDIQYQHSKSIVAPGSTVGATSAEAVAGSSTQMTLNTFHHSGSADSVSSGIKSIQNLVYARENIKNEKCTIYFKKFLTYEEVLHSRNYIVGSVIKDFVKSYVIDYPNNLQKFIDFDDIQLIFGKEVEDERQILRLFLDPIELYKHRVTLSQIADQLESDQSKSITTIFSSMSEGIIDIYINKDVVDAKIEGKDKKDFSNVLENVPAKYRDLAFFTTIIIPELSKIRIKGVIGITKLFPIVIPIIKMIGTETKNKDLWTVKFNTSFMRSHGLKSKHLIRLFELAGIKTIDDKITSIVVHIPGNSKESPSFVVNQKIRASKNDANERIRNSHNKLIQEARNAEDTSISKTPVIINRDNIVKASELVIAETKGSNLKDLLALRGIDKTRTTCNNMFVMANLFGIEAARIFFIKELGKIIADAGSYINPVNIMLLSEIIMNTGIPSGTNYAGISRQNVDHLTQATIERAGKTFIKSALHSRTESTNNTTAAIIMGSRGKFGTGFTNIGYDIIKNGETVTIVNDEIEIAHHQDDNFKPDIPKKNDTFADIDFSAFDDLLGEPLINVNSTFISGYPLVDELPPKDTVPILSAGLVYELEEHYPVGQLELLDKIYNLMNEFSSDTVELPNLESFENVFNNHIPDRTEVTDLKPIDMEKFSEMLE